jgi:hypothetical protein
MQSLRDLQMYCNTTHLDALGKLADLEHLRIQNPSLAALPAAFAGLKKLRRCFLDLPELSELPNWLSEWADMYDLVIQKSKSFDLRQLLVFPKIFTCHIHQTEPHPTDWAGFEPKIYLEHINGLEVEVVSPSAEIAQQSLAHLLSACGNALYAFTYRDPALSEIPAVWDKLKKVSHVQFAGTFKTIPAPTQPVAITWLSLHSEEWEDFDINWSHFTYLQTLEICKKFPPAKEKLLRKILPKHIKIRHSYR